MLTHRASLGIPASRSTAQAMVRYTVASVVAIAALLVPRDRLDAPWARFHVASVPVVVAAKDMPEGVIVDRVSLVVAQWPVGSQPAGAYTAVDSVAGRVTRVAVYKGEAIVPGRLLRERTATGDVRLPPGKRAYNIRITNVASLAGMVQHNSRVDIMVVIDDPDQSKRVAKLFMSNMRVLAILEGTERGPTGRAINAALASIEVTPEQSERLAMASAAGSLQLVLRGYGDPDSISTRGAVADDVLTNIRRSRTPANRRKQR